MNEKTRIAINAQVIPENEVGGVGSVLIGLISSLRDIDDGKEEYVIIGNRYDHDWLLPHIGSNQRIICVPKPESNSEEE